MRQEPLDLARAGDGNLVLFRQLVNTQNGNDVLQILVALQDALYRLGGVVVLIAHDARRQNARGGSQRIDRRVDTDLRQGAV